MVTLKIIFDWAGIKFWLYGKWETLQQWSRSYFPRNWTSPSWGVKKLSSIKTRNQVLPSHVSSLHSSSSTQGTWLHLARHLHYVRNKEYEKWYWLQLENSDVEVVYTPKKVAESEYYSWLTFYYLNLYKKHDQSQCLLVIRKKSINIAPT